MRAGADAKNLDSDSTIGMTIFNKRRVSFLKIFNLAKRTRGLRGSSSYTPQTPCPLCVPDLPENQKPGAFNIFLIFPLV